MKTSTAIATSICTALGIIYVGAVQIPAFLGSLSMIRSYEECGDAVAALTSEALINNSVRAEKELQAGCAGIQVKSEIANKVLIPARN